MVVLGHGDLAGENNEKTRGNLACSRQLFASRKRTHVTEPTHPFDIRRSEFEKYLIVALVESRLQWCRHDAP
jgi:hypothetical protein